ncbi:polysaccharide biosynthesis tyrosine autokinase [Fibrobacter sp. UWEL]|uniref:polysaccharide biosynthesis tyrosine autokinase n=1 Tax=Fibrobacter sp. UWEL TaxID=1896209 RepID=UPI000922B97B|nr:polysaccharide biosynthesis tyrosine autokinase [Fibrobacter sp. UWEL]SHK29767.1 tyrosine-protein kinase Etk/Wzc [Fibrobacter sp. UWEL]
MKDSITAPVTPTTINLTGIQNIKPKGNFSLVKAVDVLWKQRWLLLTFVLVGAAVGVFVGNWIRPQYSSDALLKLEVKSSKSNKSSDVLDMLFAQGSPADAEIEMIKSRRVLSYVVDAEGLCYKANPIGLVDRLRHHEGRMDVQSLVLPTHIRDGWTAKIVNDRSYVVYSPDGRSVMKGVVGKESSATYKGESVSILVSKISGVPGQRFDLEITSSLKAARSLANKLIIEERGKQTGIIGITYAHRYPDRAVSILNSLADVYLNQNIEMRSAEAAKTLQFLEEQLPGVKARLDSAEKKLADYRQSVGAVDLSVESQSLLKKEQDLTRQISALEQKRQETTRLFKAEHPSVQAITRQLSKARSELNKLKNDAGKMPATQQEMLALQEQVATNNAQYTSMLNNIQQLRTVRAGEVGTVTVVDYAVEDNEQIKPRKARIFFWSVGIFLFAGVMLVLLMRLFRNGVRNALEIERKTGVSVYAKVPESSNRDLKKKSRKGTLPLVCCCPEDPASEALRSVFTSVEFSAAAERPVIMVAGLVAGVGKSFVSRNLAALYANFGKKVLLVDVDMRRGVVYSKHSQGLADILSGKMSFDECLSKTDVDNMWVIGAGKPEQAPTDLLHGETFADMLRYAKQNFDVIVLDTPPINLVADTELVLPLVDFSLFVLHYGRHTMDEIDEAVTKVNRLSESPKAFVMNHCDRFMSSHYYYNGYSSYGFKKK